MSEERCAIKFTHDNGKKLTKPISWCGRSIDDAFEWHFLDAQHLALAAGGSVQPCKQCVQSLIDQLSIEIN